MNYYSAIFQISNFTNIKRILNINFIPIRMKILEKKKEEFWKTLFHMHRIFVH